MANLEHSSARCFVVVPNKNMISKQQNTGMAKSGVADHGYPSDKGDTGESEKVNRELLPQRGHERRDGEAPGRQERG